MRSCIIRLVSGECTQVTRRSTLTGRDIHTEVERYEQIPIGDYYILCSGHRVIESEEIRDGSVCSVVPRLVGGKGGFGSMLRAIGAQIEKTTNREACRDLSGRRMRDVNNEKKLREWVSHQADREREKEERRQARLERRRAVPRHTFSNPVYEQQKMQVTENLDDALQQGLQSAASSKATTSSTDSKKRKSEEPGPSTSKKACEWFGVEVDPDDLSDLDSSDDSEDGTQTDTKCLPPDSGNVSPSTDKQSDVEAHSDSGVDSLVDRKEALDVTGGEQDSLPESMEVDSGSLHSGKLEGSSLVEGDLVGGVRSRDLSDNKSSGELQTPAGSQTSETVVQAAGSVSEDLSQYTSVAQLESLGLDGLKVALLERGMKCGGTLEERAARLFPVRCLTKDQIDPTLLAKGGKSKGKGKGKKK